MHNEFCNNEIARNIFSRKTKHLHKKHKHIFIYHQKPDILNEQGELVDAKGDAKLIITTGEHEDMRIKSHAVYFLRTVADQKAGILLSLSLL